ncbi:MAG: hypothetical protein KA746_05495 [Pyrinomonadaceae bacterium]|nr:hypothetical protein [Pyrinomonadaceae bacterium]
MKRLKCISLRVILKIDSTKFDKDAFIADINPKKPDSLTFSYSYGTKDPKRKEHGHLFSAFFDDNWIIDVSFAPGPSPDPDVREPFLENMTTWLSSFFKETMVDAQLSAVFEFDNSFESLVQLDYPLLTPDRLLTNVKVVGHDLEFPPESYINQATITRYEKTAIRIFLYSFNTIDVSQFVFIDEVKKFSKYALSLVRRTE